MGLREVFAAWRELTTRYLADDDQPAPGIEFSSNAVSLQKSAPQIVWAPTTEQIQWTVVGSIGNNSQPIASRALRGRVVTVEIWIWGKDFGNAEAMAQAAVAAAHDLFWGFDDARAIDWTRGQQVTAKSGVLAILTVTIELPITRQADTLAVINDFTPMGKEIATGDQQ